MPADDRCELLCIDLPLAERIRACLDSGAAIRGANRARALADPTRLALALALTEADELCVCDLAWIAGRDPNIVGHHLRALRSAGLARSRRDHKFVLYTLTADGRRAVELLTATRATA